MEDCCGRRPDTSRQHCPSCGRAGRQVGRITLKALLKPQALARIAPGEYRFCPLPDCPVVYFGDGEPFRREDVLVPVFPKETEGARIVCYCFGVNEDLIRREVHSSGASISAKRITELVRAGRCACEVRNPEGTCCLGNVMALVTARRAARNPVADDHRAPLP